MMEPILIVRPPSLAVAEPRPLYRQRCPHGGNRSLASPEVEARIRCYQLLAEQQLPLFEERPNV
jgi:hypothetical protein